MRWRFLVAGLLLATAAHAAPARITEPQVRAFVERQEAAWNAKDAGAWAGRFTADARFVDQARGSDNRIVPNGTSTLAEAVGQARRFFAKSRFHETFVVDRVQIAPDGGSAQVWSHETIRLEMSGKPLRTLCTETEQTLVFDHGRLRSRGQTDTSVRCEMMNRIHPG